MLSLGALLGVYAQTGATPLYTACEEGHVEVVELLLSHPDVLVNQAEKVRRRGW
jgi:ankyrin repeat protein